MRGDRRITMAAAGGLVWVAAVIVAALSTEGRVRFVLGVGLVSVVVVATGAVVLVQVRRYHRASLAALRAGQAEVQRELRERSASTASSSRGQAARLEALVALHHRLDQADELPMLRGFVAAPDVLTLLYDLVRAERPRLVVECGSGASSVVIARALARNGSGRLVSLEHIEGYAEATRELLERAGLGHLVDVVSAPLVPTGLPDHDLPWYDWRRAGPLPDIGLLFVDGPPAAVGLHSRYPALPILAGSLIPGALVVVDDAARSDESAVIDRWCTTLPLEVELAPEAGLERGSAVLRLVGRGARDTGGSSGDGSVDEGAGAPPGSA